MGPSPYPCCSYSFSLRFNPQGPFDLLPNEVNVPFEQTIFWTGDKGRGGTLGLVASVWLCTFVDFQKFPTQVQMPVDLICETLGANDSAASDGPRPASRTRRHFGDLCEGTRGGGSRTIKWLEQALGTTGAPPPDGSKVPLREEIRHRSRYGLGSLSRRNGVGWMVERK